MSGERTFKLQEKDEKILSALQKNARLGVKQIARSTDIPITTVFNRIRNLESRGIIQGYQALVDRKKLGKEIEAFIIVSVSYNSLIPQEEFALELSRLPDVEECYVISGATNILIKVSSDNIDTLNEFIINSLKKKGVEGISTYIIIKKY